MWPPKQNNEVFPGRMTSPFKSQPPRDENIRVPTPSDVSDRDFLAESSRKRKAVVMGHPDNATSDAICQSISGNHWFSESNHQHKLGVLGSAKEQGNTTRGFSNQIPRSLESGGKVFQPGRYQSQGLYSYSLNSQTIEKNFPNVEAEKTVNLQTTPPHAFHQKGPPNVIISPAGKLPTLPDSQSISFSFLNESEANKHHCLNPVDTSTEKALSGHGSVDGTNFGQINHILKANLSTDLSSKISELLSSLEGPKLTHEVYKRDGNLDERMLNKDIHKTWSSSGMKQNGQALDVARTMGISIVGTSSFETARHKGDITEQSFQTYNSTVRTGSPPNDGVKLKLRDQNDGNRDTQVMEGKDGSNMGDGSHLSGEDVSPKISDDPTHVPTGNGDNSQHVARKFDGKAKSDAEKGTPTEKLWDGSLQLSASVTVSAVAFFKSGEKAPELNWSKCIVVKGKVRLEAFERYIQELPRSRSRGLMVTSLCWRVGSSKTGLSGMKEVAKGYKGGEKVGFAQLSRGIDLYVCPRSDAIITILAKYGFFKGMAALEEDQDSLIGCVVWRRNQLPSVTEKTKTKIPPLSDQSSEIQQNSATEKPHVAPQNSAINSHTSREVETPIMQNSGPDKRNADDDDDLPEFDFGIACGISQPSVGKNASIHVSAEESKNVGVLTPSTLPAVQPNCCGEGESSGPALPLVDEKPTPVGKNLWDDDDDMPEWCPPDMEQQSKLPMRPSPVLPPAPPPMGTSRPSSSYVQSPARNWKPPGPPPGPPFPRPPPPPPTRPVGGDAPIGPNFSLGFTYKSMSRPQPNTFHVRPAGWRG